MVGPTCEADEVGASRVVLEDGGSTPDPVKAMCSILMNTLHVNIHSTHYYSTPPKVCLKHHC